MGRRPAPVVPHDDGDVRGDNTVTYGKTCEPNPSDVPMRPIDPAYLPEVRQLTALGNYSYPYEYYAAGPSRVTLDDGIHECVHRETAGTDERYTYRANCGSINRPSPIKTERLEDEPVCTGRAVTERFALKTKYFPDGANTNDGASRKNIRLAIL